MIPQTFNDWQYCITKECNIELTKDFIQRRLKVYTDKDNPETQQFMRLYGKNHLENIIHWLSKYEYEIPMK